MKTVMIEDLVSWGPCYGEARIRELAGGVTSFTALDVLRREDISVEDRFWVVLRPEMIQDRLLHEFACDVAEHVQPPNADPRSLNAIATKRRWLRGEASNEELIAARDAARDAAWDAAAWDAEAAARAAAAWAAAWAAAAWDAAWAAAWDAAWDAARDAAWDASSAECEWQRVHLVKMLEADNGN